MSADKLKSLSERINRLLDERDGINGDISDLYQEAKSAGYIAKVLRKAIGRQRMDAGKRAEEDSILELYEAALEGLALFLIISAYTRRPRPTMAASGLFLTGYGVARIVVEFVRVPDIQIGYLALGWVTMGQILSLPLVIIGLVLMWLSRGGPVATPAADRPNAPTQKRAA